MVDLTIIIAYYKTYELTCKMLDTLIPQLNDKVEVILIDDGCNENRLDKYKEINIIHLKENKGGAFAENRGIEKAKGKYIGFIDSDDMIANDYIETLLKAIKERSEDVILFDWQDMNNGNIVHHPTNYAPWKAIYNRNIIPMFDENVIYSFDVPFIDKLNSKTYTKCYLDKVLYYYNSNREGNLTLEKEKIRRLNMIKLKANQNFTLERFDELVDIQRKNIDTKGKLYEGDTFKCERELADYLLGKNDKNVCVAELIEVEPKVEIKIETKLDGKSIKKEVVKPTKKKGTK